jgi:superfamily I DNA and/or RNA helicase
VEKPGRYSKSRGGPIREASVAAVVAHVKLLLATTPLKPGDILVLTPFRAQQGLLRDALADAQVGGVRVSTVHRAQGSERLAVLFDPVDGRSGFLRGVAGNRLVNVAFSRAEAHLAIFLGPKDNTNPLFEFCAE